VNHPQEETAPLNKEEIIFFDTLGLGWVVDVRIIMAVFASDLAQETVSERDLWDRIQKQHGQI
jgi:hypothetical protein